MWSLGDLGVSDMGGHVEIRASVSEQDGIGREAKPYSSRNWENKKREPR